MEARLWFDAHRHLSQSPGPIASVIRAQGVLSPAVESDSCRAVVSAIVGQQLSTRAAEKIRTRLFERLGTGCIPDALAGLSDSELRACGLSTAKVRSVRDLAARVQVGALDFLAMQDAEDERIRETLVAVHGIGDWTANMFLIFGLGRPDVLASTDFGIQVAVGRLLGLSSRATAQQVGQAAREGHWHPFASAACLHLWRYLDDPADQKA